MGFSLVFSQYGSKQPADPQRLLKLSSHADSLQGAVALAKGGNENHYRSTWHYCWRSEWYWNNREAADTTRHGSCVFWASSLFWLECSANAMNKSKYVMWPNWCFPRARRSRRERDKRRRAQQAVSARARGTAGFEHAVAVRCSGRCSDELVGCYGSVINRGGQNHRVTVRFCHKQPGRLTEALVFPLTPLLPIAAVVLFARGRVTVNGFEKARGSTAVYLRFNPVFKKKVVHLFTWCHLSAGKWGHPLAA